MIVHRVHSPLKLAGTRGRNPQRNLTKVRVFLVCMRFILFSRSRCKCDLADIWPTMRMLDPTRGSAWEMSWI